jgi:hypothetical protein
MKTKFNYGVGHYWDEGEGSVGLYTYHNDMFFGTMKEAKKFREYVKKQSPDREWKIFQLVEVPE